MHNLVLYYSERCYFCNIVVDFIKEKNIKVDYKEIKKQDNLSYLFKTTNRQTVPCLFIDDVPMYESKDIIEWMKSNINQLRKNQ